jgi:hypothetical protein
MAGTKDFLSDLCAPAAPRPPLAGVSRRNRSRRASRRLDAQVPTALLRRTVPTRQTSSASYLVTTRPCCRDLLIYCDSAGAEIIAADVRRFGHVINKDGVLGTHGA